jgi:uncharacterized protein
MAFSDADIANAHRAASGSASADTFYKLGLIYSSGQGAPVDLIEAHKWFNLAALRGHEGAKAYRRECAEMMSKSEIAAAQRAAREWLNVGSDQGPASPPAGVVKPAATAKPVPLPAEVQAAKPAKPSISAAPTSLRYNRAKRPSSTPVFAA